LSLFFSLQFHVDHRVLHSFPTRRSSDLSSEYVARSRARRSNTHRASADRCGQAGAASTSRRPLRNRERNAAAKSFDRNCAGARRSEEHTSELQSLRHLVCRLLLEKKNIF